MKSIICIGSVCKDIFFPTSEGLLIETPEDVLAQKKIAFELGAKYKIEKRTEALGGCAANVAVGLSRLGIDSGCYSKIGDDYIGDWILEQLEKNKVGSELIKKEENCASDMSAIVVDSKSAERVIFSNQKANGMLVINPDDINSAKGFFIGDLHGNWENHLDAIFALASSLEIMTAFNPRQINIHDNVQKIIEKIKNTDVLFLNKDESMEIIMAPSSEQRVANSEKINDEEYLLQELKKLGAKVVVLTDGTRGAWASDGKNTFYAPAQKVPAVDSTGAGDSFASGFLAAHIKGQDLPECLKWGIINSSSSVQFYGAIDGLLGEKEILEKIDLIEVKNLK